MEARQTVVTAAVVAVLAFAVAGCDPGGSGSGASSKCRGLAHVADAAQKFSTFLTASNPDPNEFVEEFHDFSFFRYIDLVGGAPDEIRGDIQVLDDGFQKYVDAFAAWEPANLDQAGKLDRKALEKLQHPQPPSIDIDKHRVMQASQNISAWVQRMRKSCT
jgi:hypothetical protein